MRAFVKNINKSLRTKLILLMVCLLMTLSVISLVTFFSGLNYVTTKILPEEKTALNLESSIFKYLSAIKKYTIQPSKNLASEIDEHEQEVRNLSNKYLSFQKANSDAINISFSIDKLSDIGKKVILVKDDLTNKINSIYQDSRFLNNIIKIKVDDTLASKNVVNNEEKNKLLRILSNLLEFEVFLDKFEKKISESTIQDLVDTNEHMNKLKANAQYLLDSKIANNKNYEKTIREKISNFVDNQKNIIPLRLEIEVLLESIQVLENETYQTLYNTKQKSSDNVETSINLFLLLFILIIVATTIMALIATNKLSSRITRPIFQLKKASDSFRLGRLDSRVEIQTSDEIGDLSQSFNTMADNIVEDIFKIKKSQQLTARLGRILDNSSNYICVVNPDTNKIIQTNKSLQKDLHYSKQDIEQLCLSEIMLSPDNQKLENLISNLGDSINETVNIEGIIKSKNNTHIPIEFNLQLTKEENSDLLVIIAKNITERKASEERMHKLAYYDSLTSLPNRESFNLNLAKEIEKSKAEHSSLAVALFGLDRFKIINDNLGNRIGDLLLKRISKRISKFCQDRNNTLISPKNCRPEIISRQGGDEFGVLLKNIHSPDDITKAIRGITKSITEPLDLEGNEIVTTPSVGVAIYPKDGGDENTIIKNASTAMSNAKEKGGNCYKFYSENMNLKTKKILTVENNIRKALEDGRFTLYYQPQVNAENNQLTGVEALIRYHDENGRVVVPAEFIEYSKQTGQIIDIDLFAAKRACRDMKLWIRDNIPIPKVSVNLSSEQFTRKELVGDIKKILDDEQLPASCLDLEITESTIIHSFESTVTSINKFKDMGISISLDDFGTGYSSLSYLSRFPIDSLKIDKSFIQNATKDEGNANIVKAIISLGKSLGLHIVAEGVETEEELQFLKSNGVNIIQGYYYSKPIDFSQMTVYANLMQSFKKVEQG